MLHVAYAQTEIENELAGLKTEILLAAGSSYDNH